MIDIFIYIYFFIFYNKKVWKDVVNNKLFSVIGKRNFYFRFNNWFIFILGKVYFVIIVINENK